MSYYIETCMQLSIFAMRNLWYPSKDTTNLCPTTSNLYSQRNYNWSLSNGKDPNCKKPIWWFLIWVWFWINKKIPTILMKWDPLKWKIKSCITASYSDCFILLVVSTNSFRMPLTMIELKVVRDQLFRAWMRVTLSDRVYCLLKLLTPTQTPHGLRFESGEIF